MIGYSQTCNTCSIRSSPSSIISIKGKLKIGMGQLSSIKVKNRLLNIYGPAKESSYGYAIIYKRKLEIYFWLIVLIYGFLELIKRRSILAGQCYILSQTWPQFENFQDICIYFFWVDIKMTSHSWNVDNIFLV